MRLQAARRAVFAATLIAIVGCARVTPSRSSPQSRGAPNATGISFTIEQTRDGDPVPGVFDGFAGVVRFAAGRGRLDITERSSRKDVVVAGARIATPLAAPGDYYLFDSTGFVLVRSRSRTFSSFVVKDASFNFQNRRDGWPEWFRFANFRVDTLADSVSTLDRAPERAEVHIYWHLDDPTRGRFTLTDAPLGEIAVARWFGMSQALGEIAVARWFGVSQALGILPLRHSPVLLTAVAPIPTAGNGQLLGPQVNLISTHSTSAVLLVDVPLSLLQLPADFVETPWSGTSVSTESGARWKRAPRR